MTKWFMCRAGLFSLIIERARQRAHYASGASIDLQYTIAGFLVGVLVGFTGVGGGSLMTPILIVLFGFSPATAVGTDLLFAAATKTVGSVVHGFNRTIEWRVVWRLQSS